MRYGVWLRLGVKRFDAWGTLTCPERVRGVLQRWLKRSATRQAHLVSRNVHVAFYPHNPRDPRRTIVASTIGVERYEPEDGPAIQSVLDDPEFRHSSIRVAVYPPLAAVSH
jgi:hypothetical protein